MINFLIDMRTNGRDTFIAPHMPPFINLFIYLFYLLYKSVMTMMTIMTMMKNAIIITINYHGTYTDYSFYSQA